MTAAAAKVAGEQKDKPFEAPPELEKITGDVEVSIEAQEPQEAPVAEVEVKDEGLDSLKQQLADLRRSEEQARQQAIEAQRIQQEAIRAAQERQVQLSQMQFQSAEGNLLAVNNAIVAAQAEADKAQAEMEQAGNNQDFAAMAQAQRRLARAEARLEQLETGKSTLEAQVQQQKATAEYQAQWLQQQRQQQAQQAQQGDSLDQTQLPQRAKAWLRAHPEYMTDTRKNAKIQALHYDVKDETGEEFTEKYFNRMEELLGLRQAPSIMSGTNREQIEEPVRQRSVPVSAPVSREAPSSASSAGSNPSKVRLTEEQREIARSAGITDAEYAKNLIRMRKLKESGDLQ